MPQADILRTRTINYLELTGHGKSYRALSCQCDCSYPEELWEDLWSDIAELRHDPEGVNYMSALVVEGSNEREFLIIDDQQRVATLGLSALAVSLACGPWSSRYGPGGQHGTRSGPPRPFRRGKGPPPRTPKAVGFT